MSNMTIEGFIKIVDERLERLKAVELEKSIQVVQKAIDALAKKMEGYKKQLAKLEGVPATPAPVVTPPVPTPTPETKMVSFTKTGLPTGKELNVVLLQYQTEGQGVRFHFYDPKTDKHFYCSRSRTNYNNPGALKVLFYDLLHITGKKVAENERVNRFEETKNRLLNRKVKIQVDLVKGLTNIQFRGVWA
jgi:hypothetical protein